jgi:hypothetical protein
LSLIGQQDFERFCQTPELVFPLAGGFAIVRQLGGGKLTNTKPPHRVKHTHQAKNLFLALSNYNPRVISYG